MSTSSNISSSAFDLTAIDSRKRDSSNEYFDKSHHDQKSIHAEIEDNKKDASTWSIIRFRNPFSCMRHGQQIYFNRCWIRSENERKPKLVCERL